MGAGAGIKIVKRKTKSMWLEVITSAAAHCSLPFWSARL